MNTLIVAVTLIFALFFSPSAASDQKKYGLGSPVEGFNCVDFRTALEQLEMAYEVAVSFEGSPPWPYDFEDKSPEAQAWFQTKLSLQNTVLKGIRDVREKRNPIISALKDEYAMTTMADFRNVIAALAALDGSVRAWRFREDSPTLYRHASFHAIVEKTDEMYAVADAAYNEALKLACKLGLAKDDK